MLLRKHKHLFVLAVALLGYVCHANAQQDTLRVLFVGNSYTYFWNLPKTVQAMAAEDDVVIVTRQSTAGGSTWKEHWDGEKELKSRRIISEGEWDFVVLQNHSRSTIDHLEQFMDYGSRFIELVREANATPILYMTWAREYNPLMQSHISSGYRELAQQHGVAVVPVGEIWQEVGRLRPDLNIFDPDGSHPSTLGTYMNACAFYSFLQDKPATGLPPRIKTTDANGEVLYLSIMSEQDAEFMQAAVDEILEKTVHE